MTDHRIHVLAVAAGALCSVCGRPVAWVRGALDSLFDDEQDSFVGHWAHVYPDDLAASMARHPAKGKPL